MAIWNIDTGILFSALGLVATIALFIFKTLGSKNEKMIVYGEAIKRYEESIADNRKDIDMLFKDVSEIKLNLLTLTGKMTGFTENIATLLASNQFMAAKLNQHDIDITSLKKDIEFMKIEGIHDRKEADYLRSKMERLIDDYNEKNKRKEKIS